MIGVNDIKAWSVQKKVFYGFAAATIVTGLVYGGIRISDYMRAQKLKKNKNKK